MRHHSPVDNEQQAVSKIAREAVHHQYIHDTSSHRIHDIQRIGHLSCQGHDSPQSLDHAVVEDGEAYTTDSRGSTVQHHQELAEEQAGAQSVK